MIRGLSQRGIEEADEISTCSNLGLTLAEGEWIALLDHDDLLEPDALFICAMASGQSETDLIYSDEDELTEEGFDWPWSPDFFLSYNYLSIS